MPTMVRGYFARQYFHQLQSRSRIDTCEADGDPFCSSQWYFTANEPSFHDLPLQKFHLDAEGKEFLQASIAKADSVCLQVFHSLLIPLLSICFSKTNINGILHRGSMFIFSSEQFRNHLIPASFWDDGTSQKVLLDIGAGDGGVTSKMAPFFSHTFTTEYSFSMRRRLRAKGFTVARELEEFEDQSFDLISLLNVLDRTDFPSVLIQRIIAKMKTSKHRSPLLLVAAVLPLSQYFEYGQGTTMPTEELDVEGREFEDQIRWLVKYFNEFGLEVVSFAKMPYLCEGDTAEAFYHLDDAVFVLKLK